MFSSKDRFPTSGESVAFKKKFFFFLIFTAGLWAEQRGGQGRANCLPVPGPPGHLATCTRRSGAITKRCVDLLQKNPSSCPTLSQPLGKGLSKHIHSLPGTGVNKLLLCHRNLGIKSTGFTETGTCSHHGHPSLRVRSRVFQGNWPRTCATDTQCHGEARGLLRGLAMPSQLTSAHGLGTARQSSLGMSVTDPQTHPRQSSKMPPRLPDPGGQPCIICPLLWGMVAGGWNYDGPSPP